MNRIKLLLCFIPFCIGFCTPINSLSKVKGIIKDSSGIGIPNASIYIELIHSEPCIGSEFEDFEIKSDESGNFEFSCSLDCFLDMKLTAQSNGYEAISKSFLKVNELRKKLELRLDKCKIEFSYNKIYLYSIFDTNSSLENANEFIKMEIELNENRINKRKLSKGLDFRNDILVTKKEASDIWIDSIDKQNKNFYLKVSDSFEIAKIESAKIDNSKFIFDNVCDTSPIMFCKYLRFDYETDAMILIRNIKKDYFVKLAVADFSVKDVLLDSANTKVYTLFFHAIFGSNGFSNLRYCGKLDLSRFMYYKKY